jgi:hypothetical protein
MARRTNSPNYNLEDMEQEGEQDVDPHSFKSNDNEIFSGLNKLIKIFEENTRATVAFEKQKQTPLLPG